MKGLTWYVNTLIYFQRRLDIFYSTYISKVSLFSVWLSWFLRRTSWKDLAPQKLLLFQISRWKNTKELGTPSTGHRLMIISTIVLLLRWSLTEKMGTSWNCIRHARKYKLYSWLFLQPYFILHTQFKKSFTGPQTIRFIRWCSFWHIPHIPFGREYVWEVLEITLLLILFFILSKIPVFPPLVGFSTRITRPIRCGFLAIIKETRVIVS